MTFFSSHIEVGGALYVLINAVRASLSHWGGCSYSLAWDMLIIGAENHQCESGHPMKVEAR